MSWGVYEGVLMMFGGVMGDVWRCLGGCFEVYWGVFEGVLGGVLRCLGGV